MRRQIAPFSIIRLHFRDDRCWAVVDATGAIVDLDGLSMKLAQSDARAFAEKLNLVATTGGEPPRRMGPPEKTMPERTANRRSGGR